MPNRIAWPLLAVGLTLAGGVAAFVLTFPLPEPDATPRESPRPAQVVTTSPDDAKTTEAPAKPPGKPPAKPSAKKPEREWSKGLWEKEKAEVERLEGWIDEATDAVPPLRNFILPGGSEGGVRLHVARSGCRRAERAVITLASSEEVRPVIIHYLNRLSDLLFAWARETNHTQSQPEIPWEPTHPQT